ncbi:S8 family peptidase [soil metagenome]
MKFNKSIVVFLSVIFTGLISFSFAPQSTNKYFEKFAFERKLSLQSEIPDWALLDPKDGYEGTSTLELYKYIKEKGLKTKKQVVVAIIDSGIDTEHPAIKDNLWDNEAEINGLPGVDDDGNGYVDDFHGWNFLGKASGLSLEATREMVRLRRLGTPSSDPYYKKVFEKVETEKEETIQIRDGVIFTLQQVEDAEKVLRSGNYPVNRLELSKITNTLTGKFKDAANTIMTTYMLYGMDKESLVKIKAEYQKKASVLFDTTDTYKIIGDDPNDLTEKGYGDNQFDKHPETHGTHVCGIICSNISTIGQAPFARFMTLRTIPDEGDERDKDVANAIRYAVDNGADVINMSAGKYFSPNPELVVEAEKYAESKGVVYVSSAGNEGTDIEQVINYPRKFIIENGSIKYFSNLIVVGSNSWMKTWSSAKDPDNDNSGFDLLAPFSNYSGKIVDIYAPGVQIRSTVPGGKFEYLSGTSMSSPEVTGIVAILKAYFPDLTGMQIKDIINSTARKYDGLQVKVKGKNSKVDFGSLSRSGGVIDAFSAFKKAEQVSVN